MSFLTEDSYRKIFLGITIFLFIIMLFVSKDSGISWDESIQKSYGEQIVNYYVTWGQDKSALYSPALHLQFYGGIFDVITVALYKAVNAFVTIDEYDLRHLVTAFLGFIAIVFTGLTAKELSSWRTGVMASVFLALTPVFFGHSMYNPKDIPFASSYILGVYFITKLLKELPEIRLKTSLFVCLSIALAINIRIGGVLLIFYLVFFSGIKTVLLVATERPLTQEKVRLWRKSLVSLTFVIICSYFLGLLFWPFGLSDPLRNPLIALTQMSSYDLHVTYELFDGKWLQSNAFPWYYIPKWILITTPLFMTAGYFLIPVLLMKRLHRSSFRPSLYLLFVFFTVVFPITYIIMKKSNLYDSWRHLLFVYPPLVVVAALSWDSILLEAKKRLYRMISVGMLLIFCLEPAVWMIRNHPHQTFYFSPLIGGVNGAFKKYEIDYWGTSLRSAVEWIAMHELPLKDKQVIRIRSPYGARASTAHFVNKFNNGLVYVETPETSPGWDYSLVLPAMAKMEPELLAHWPPKGTVHEIKVDNTPLVAIVKNNGSGTEKKLQGYLNLSQQYYEAGQFERCVEISREALKMKPDYAPAYNNICAAYNELKMWDRGIEACQQALKIDPVFRLARNNLNWALSAKAAKNSH